MQRYNRRLEPETLVQNARIIADGGTIVNWFQGNSFIRMFKELEILSNCKILADANFAYKNATGVTTFYDYVSGNNNDIVQTIGAKQPIWTADVQNGRAALLFDGSDDILTIPDSSGFTLSTNGLYISFWMSFSSLAGDFQGLFSHYLDGDHRWQFYFEKAAGMMFYVNDGVNNGVVISQASVLGYAINTFYHLAIARSVNDWNLYRNGVSVKSATNSYDIQDINAPMTLGNLVDGAGTYLTSKVGGCVLFTTALSTEQRQALESLVNTYYAMY